MKSFVKVGKAMLDNAGLRQLLSIDIGIFAESVTYNRIS